MLHGISPNCGCAMKIKLLVSCCLILWSLLASGAETRRLDSSITLGLDALHTYQLQIHELQLVNVPQPELGRTVTSFEVIGTDGKLLFSKALFPEGGPRINKHGFFDDTFSIQAQSLRSGGTGIALLLSWFPAVEAPNSCSNMILLGPDDHGLQRLSGEFCGTLKFKSEQPTEAEMFTAPSGPYFYLVQKAESFEILVPVKIDPATGKARVSTDGVCGRGVECEFPIELYMPARARKRIESVSACTRPKGEICQQVRIDSRSKVRFVAAGGIKPPPTLNGNLQDASHDAWLEFEVAGKSWWTHGFENFVKLGLPGT